MNERKLRKSILKAVPFETEHLILRYILPSDADDMYEYASLPEVCEYLLWSPHLNVDATRGYIEFLQTRYKKGLYGDWAVVLKENGKMIGTCGYANINTKDNNCEIGYVLSPKYQGRGLMCEAVEAVLGLSFENFGFDYAKLRIISENERSVHLAEKLGFELKEKTEMLIKDVTREVSIYILTKEQHEKIKKEAVD